MAAHKPDKGDREPGAPTAPVAAPASDRTTAKVSGTAALWLLNDEADEWQRTTAPEMRGDYLTTIDYVTTNISRWRTATELMPKIEAAAHAYRFRSTMSLVSSCLVALAGVAIGVAGIILKSGSRCSGADQMLSGVIGGGVLIAAKQAVKMRFLEVHKERATHWKNLLNKLRVALADARAKRAEK